MLLENQTIKLEKSESRLGFTTTGGDSWKVWDRFITLDGDQLFHIGNVCGTCAFFFRQLKDDIKKSYTVDELREKLNKGINVFDDNLLDNLSELLPVTESEDKIYGEYEALLLEINPYLTRFNDAGDYFKEEQSKLWSYRDDIDPVEKAYYRGTDFRISEKAKLFEFFIPLYQPEQLNQERVEYYRQQIRQGMKPTAIALSVIDDKEAVCYDEDPEDGIVEHWSFANYILDGHHKMYAAALEHKPIILISFVTRDFSWQVVDQLIEHYNSKKNI